MRQIYLAFFLSLIAAPLGAKSFFEHQFQSIEGKTVDFEAFSGRVVLVVNTASECGFTDHYEGLQKLYEEKKSEGLVVLGFPSNDFGGQEPGSNEEIAKFCKSRFGVDFPLFSKSSVKGEKKNEIFQWLVAKSKKLNEGGEVRWNFEKFLISKEGELVGRFRSFTSPDSKKLRALVDRELSQSQKEE